MSQKNQIPASSDTNSFLASRNSAGLFQTIRSWFYATFSTRKKRMAALQVLIMVLAAFLRIGAAHTRSIVYSENSYFDEYQMLEQSRLDEYFKAENENERSMIKTLTFPWFLNLCRTLHLPLNTMMGLLWIASALCTWSMMRKWTASRWNCLFAYLFVLFCPIGFENSNGVHLYRNLILAPFLFMFFALQIGLVLDCWKKPQKRFGWIWPILGLCLVYPMAYYIKEDGFWLTPVLSGFLILAAIGLVRSIANCWMTVFKGILAGICLLLPFASFQIQTERYLDANEKTFGYRGITVRTEGPIQEYASMVYQIQSKERNMHQWAPQDAVQPTIDASLTLQSMPDFVDALRQISWGEGALLGGDFLPWRIWQAWSMTAHYQQPGNIRTIIPVFEKVCQEVQAAFDDGRIQKQTGRFQISSRAGSRSLAEVLNIFPDLLLAFDEAITLKDYNPTPPSPVNEEQDFLASFKAELGIDLTAPQNEQQETALKKQKQASKLVAQIDFGVYRIVIPVLFWGGLVCWMYEIYLYIARWILKRKSDPLHSVHIRWQWPPLSKHRKSTAAISVFGGAAAAANSAAGFSTASKKSGADKLEKPEDHYQKDHNKTGMDCEGDPHGQMDCEGDCYGMNHGIKSDQANQTSPDALSVSSLNDHLDYESPAFQWTGFQHPDFESLALPESAGFMDPDHGSDQMPAKAAPASSVRPKPEEKGKNRKGLAKTGESQSKAGGEKIWKSMQDKLHSSKTDGRRVPEGLVLFLVFMLVALSAAYEFGILWFLQFLYYLPQYAYQHIYWILYYSSGMLPMLYLALLLMIPFELRRLRQMRKTLFAGS